MNKEVLEIICKLMKVKEDEISDITQLTIGMTNRSYIFTYRNSSILIDSIINRNSQI